ncbi:NAD(P)-dependent oxidoreductase [Candidatus Izemoplasma sp. B36]|uniref:NAD(P)-dependent oxidoreductase n=1 Tax=Candidatus Izemoplasma sp. B36 TaxID=3242468 RepID=UPI0035585696
MNVYAKYLELQNFLKSQEIPGIDIVDNKKECDYMISGSYTSEDYNKNLKGVIIPYTGHNRINLDDMRKDNLKLFVTPTRSKYVAEKVVALTLALLGNVINYHNLLKKGDWSERNTEKRVPWVSVQHKKIGLFGYGRIGKIVHKMLKNFNCDFYTIDREKEYNDIKLVKNLNELVEVSDIVIISTPLNIETENIFDRQLLNQMENKYLINVGRGKIVNQKALYEALKEKKLCGYASDVWYNYPKGTELCFPCEYPIHELDNVVLSNHSGGFTTNTDDEVNQDIIKQLIRLKNKDYSNQLNLDKII